MNHKNRDLVPPKSQSLRARIAYAIAQADGDLPGMEPDTWDYELADAVIRELPELPVKISTEDQLDALPFLTVIREVRPLRKGIDYGGIYERRTSGWQCIVGTWVEPERNGQPMLPVMVLWRGKDEQ